MKVIDSDGGPIIGIGRRQLGSWMGIDGSRFSHANATYKNDYDWVCRLSHQRDRRPEIGMVLLEGEAPVFVLSQSFETAIVSSNSGNICLAQVAFSNGSWSFSQLCESDMQSPELIYSSVTVQIPFDDRFVFFDSALPGSEVADHYLEIALQAGFYEFRTAYCETGSAGLYFFMIVCV